MRTPRGDRCSAKLKSKAMHGLGLSCRRALLLQEVPPGHQHGLLRYESHELAAGHADTKYGCNVATPAVQPSLINGRVRPLSTVSLPLLPVGAIGPYLLMVGLQATDAASASLILNLEGVFTALLAWFVFKENFDRRIALGMVFIIAGIANVALALAFGGQLHAITSTLQAGLLGFVSYGLSLALFVVAAAQPGNRAHTRDAHYQHRHDADWDGTEPHTHRHTHDAVEHAHAHYPDAHHRHSH